MDRHPASAQPMPPQMPTMVPRFSGRKSVDRMVRLKGMTMAALMPCTTRAAMSCSGAADSAQATEAAAKKENPNPPLREGAKGAPHDPPVGNPGGKVRGEGFHGHLGHPGPAPKI